MGSDEALGLTEQSLRLADRFGAAPIKVRGVRIADRTLVVEFEVNKDDTTSILGEIANVMGVLSGLDVPELFPRLSVDHLGTIAFDRNGQELIWVMSSLEAAAFVAKGQPIEWLNHSTVQENTPGYRRSQADRHVGQIETALRDLLHEHGSRHGGTNYMGEVWNESRIREFQQPYRDQVQEMQSLRDRVPLGRTKRGRLVQQLVITPSVSVRRGRRVKDGPATGSR